jgi:hypothetical protein
MKYLAIFISLFLIGCVDPVETCVDEKQKSWREKNPNADYGKSSSANEKFRKECAGAKK